LKQKLQQLKQHKWFAYIALITVCIGWGTTWLASKNAIENNSVMQVAGIRQLLGGIIYLSYFFALGYRWPTKAQWKSIIILALLNFVLSNGLSTYSVAFIDSGIASVLGALVPIWVLIVSLLFQKNIRIATLSMVGIAIGFAGIILVFIPKMQVGVSKNILAGVALGTTASITWALGSLYTKSQAKQYNAYISIGWQMLLAGIMLYSSSLFMGVAKPIQDISLHTWLNIFYLVIVGSVICFYCYLYMLQRMPAYQASVYAYINPIVAIFVGWIFSNEKPTWYVFVGSAAVLIGVFIVQWSGRKQVAATTEED
jgi:drug/metabolite transporter (DMT)-like permease